MLTRIVGARELRWLTRVPGDEGFTAEHFFLLTPTADGGTHFENNEDFDGPAIQFVWAGKRPGGLERHDACLKARAEGARLQAVVLHPAVDETEPAAEASTANTSHCRCANHPVEIKINAPIYHNHLCGCSKCWKPEGALFAQTAVVPADAVEVLSGEAKLRSVDSSQSIQRHACSVCGVQAQKASNADRDRTKAKLGETRDHIARLVPRLDDEDDAPRALIRRLKALEGEEQAFATELATAPSQLRAALSASHRDTGREP